MDKINKIKIKDVTYEIGGGGSATVDSGLSTTSENAVQNKVITSELEKKLDLSSFQTTLHGVFAKYNNFGGRCAYDNIGEASLHIKSQYTGTTFTSEITDKEQLCKLVGYTGDTSYASVYTGLYAIFRAKDLYEMKSKFDKNRSFRAYVCNVPSQTEKPLYDIYQDLGNITLIAGKSYVMPIGKHYAYQDTNLLYYDNPTEITNATFNSLYETYSGDTSTMFFADWHDIRNAFESYGCGWSINDNSYNRTIYIYSSSMVSYHTSDGNKSGYYVKFIDANDFTDKQPGNTINLRYNLDYMYGASDLDDMRADISSNKTKIGKLSNLASEVVYAEPDTADSAHTFTRTINGYNIYTTDKDHRDMKVVKSINGKNGNKYGEVFIYAIVNGVDAISTDTSVKLDVRGDWNMNFKGDRHYIYNRPFYQEDPTYGDPIYLFKGTDYRECYCTNTTLQKDIAEGVLEAPFQDYTCYKEGNKYIVKRTEHISNPPSSAYGYWSGTTLTSGSSWTSIVANAGSTMDMEDHAQNNFYFRPKIDGVIHKLDNKFIQAKTINGESVLGEGEIDMSSYQTKAESVKIARLTQEQYDALTPKDENTLYIIITES